MAKLNYLMADGNVMELEVSEEFVVSYAEMEKKDAKVERCETRRHQSLNELMSYGFDFEDENMNVEERAIKNIEVENLRKAIELLEPQQKKLIEQIYLKNISITQISIKYDVSRQAIQNKIKKIIKKLKNI